MKRLLCVLASSVALSAWGQSGVDVPKAAKKADGTSIRTIVVSGDTGGYPDFERSCPVQVLAASFERPAQLVPAGRATGQTTPTLHLNYLNSSGKDIESVVLTGWIKVKDSPYDLDSVTHPFHLRLARRALLGKDIRANQALTLAGNAFGLDRVELSQVIYTDGTTWKRDRQTCVFHARADSLQTLLK